MVMLVSECLDPTGAHGRVMSRLAHELHIPLHEVQGIYRAQFERLGADARIERFLGVLAMRNTRDILRAAHA